MEQVSNATYEGPYETLLNGSQVPYIEAELPVIQHFIGRLPETWKEAPYIIYHNVKVYEKGKREEAVRRANMSMEEIKFGNSRL